MPDRAPSALRGVLLVIGATLMFALGDTAAKHLVERHPVAPVLAIRYAINTALIVLIVWPRHRGSLFVTRRTGLVLIRALILAGSSLTMGLALRVMPVAETIAIIYLAPIAVMILSGPLLGEKVSPVAWVAVGFGFAGVLLIVRPGAGLVPLGVAFALLNAAAATGYTLLSRILARTETTMALLFYTSFTGFLIFAAMLPWTLGGFAPTGLDWLLLLALGILSTGGHFLFTAAYREAPAPLLAPINYVHLVWAGGLGWLAFGHIPDGVTLGGMALVTAAGVMVALRGYFVSRSPLPGPMSAIRRRPRVNAGDNRPHAAYSGA